MVDIFGNDTMTIVEVYRGREEIMAKIHVLNNPYFKPLEFDGFGTADSNSIKFEGIKP